MGSVRTNKGNPASQKAQGQGKRVNSTSLSDAEYENQLQALHTRWQQLTQGLEGFSSEGYTDEEIAKRRQWYESRIQNVKTRIQALKLKKGTFKLPYERPKDTSKAPTTFKPKQ